jgi:3'-phosphoadenosine 5'-phosphosulfate (PAPS) 3'-phosphatase
MENALKSKIKLNNLMSLILHYLTRSNQLFLKVKSNELKLDVHYKANNEKFTDADWILQKMFENYFSKYFPTLKIIGEENTSDDLIKSSEFFSVNEEVNMNIIEESQIPKNLTEINSEDLTIYIDPIDSTEQFIKRNFGPVTTLVGITLKSIPIVGFIYFNQFDLDGKAPRPLVLMNIPQKGIFLLPHRRWQVGKSINQRAAGR